MMIYKPCRSVGYYNASTLRYNNTELAITLRMVLFHSMQLLTLFVLLDADRRLQDLHGA
jgi:hypothetical protein